MKYWLTTTEFPPFFGGGIGTYASETVAMLSCNNVETTVFLPDSNVKLYKIDLCDNYRVISFNPNLENCAKYLGYSPAVSYSLAKVIIEVIKEEGSPDFIETQDYLGLGYYLLQFKHFLCKELDNVPIIVTLHSPAFLYLHYNREGEYKFPNYWIGELEKSCIASADIVISPSHYLVNEIKKNFKFDRNVHLVRNPFKVTCEENTSTIKVGNIIFYGKLSPQKGIFEVLDYLKEMYENHFPYSVSFIGGGDKVYYPEMKTMKQMVYEKHGSLVKDGKIKLIGKINPNNKKNHLQDAHIILIPSSNDNLPYAAIEAMAMGKVVLASMQGGQAELIKDGENGFLFDHFKDQDFRKKIEYILSLPLSTIQSIGQKAMQTIQSKLSPENIFHQKISLLKAQSLIPAPELQTFPFTIELPGAPLATKPDLKQFESGLLSIVIPYYNMGDYILETISSIQSSEYSTYEIIIVDDGSTDSKSIDILEAFLHTPEIKIVRKKNEGLAKCRNYGAMLARGEFLAFLDADDTVNPFYYKKAIEILNKYKNIHFCGAWVNYFGEKKGIWPTWNPEPPYILLHNSVNSSGLVYKRNSFLQGGLNDEMTDYGIEDYESVINMLSNNLRGIVIPMPLFNYRVRKNSMYRKLTLFKTLYSLQYIARKHEGLYKEFGREIYCLQNSNGPSYSFDNPCFETKVTTVQSGEKRIILFAKNILRKNPRIKSVVLQIKNLFNK